MELAFETQQEYTASAMSKKKPKSERTEKEPRRTTPTFLLELPLVVQEGQAKRLRAHLEVGRQFYNAVLSAGQKRLPHARRSGVAAGPCSPPHPEAGAPSRLCGL